MDSPSSYLVPFFFRTRHSPLSSRRATDQVSGLMTDVEFVCALSLDGGVRRRIRLGESNTVTISARFCLYVCARAFYPVLNVSNIRTISIMTYTELWSRCLSQSSG